MNATSRLAPSASSPPSVDEPSASTVPFATLSPSFTTGFWWISVPWFERMNFVRLYSSRVPLPSTTIVSASTSITGPSLRDMTTSPVSIAARYSTPVPTSGACGIISGTACRCMFAPIRARFASLCSRNGISAVATETICDADTSMYWTSFGDDHHGLACARAAEHLLVQELAGLLVDRLGGLRDRELRLLGGVEVHDLVGHLAALDDPVRRLDEAELGHGRHRGERADEADVRAFRRLDRAHAAVVGRVHVAHLDRRPLARQAAGAERAEAAAMGEAGERVRLVHELRQLRGAEELLQRRHDGPDVDDRLRRDRVDVLRRHPLADDPLHPVEADPERLLDQLAGRPQAPVAEVLVLVELGADRVAVQLRGVRGVVLRVLGHAEVRRQGDQPPHEREDVLGREHARVLRHADAEPLVQLVAADLRQVVALGVEEQRLAAGCGRCRASAAHPGAAS